jgi:hypothetical protein
LFQVIRCPSDSAGIEAPLQGPCDLLVLYQFASKKFGHNLGGQIVRRWPKSPGSDDPSPSSRPWLKAQWSFAIVGDRENAATSPDCKKPIRNIRRLVSTTLPVVIVPSAQNYRPFNHTLSCLATENIFSISKK